MPPLSRRTFTQLASSSVLALHLPAYAQQARILLPVNVCGSFGYIDTKGTLMVPARYDAALAFCYGTGPLCAAMASWGYIDQNGKETLALQYDEARNFRWNCSPVRMAGQMALHPPRRIRRFFAPLRTWPAVFQNARAARVSLNGKMGLH